MSIQADRIAALSPAPKTRSLAAKEAAWGYVFISPWIVGFLAFSLFPIVAVFYLSLTQYSVLEAPIFAGLANYRRMLSDDPLIYQSLYNTAYYVLLRVPAWTVVGLGLAMLLNQGAAGIKLYRTAFYLPTLMPMVASSVVWLWLLHPQAGLLNPALRAIGINAPNWLRTEEWAKPAIVMMGLWQVGSIMVIFLAGLQEVPEHLYEAAEIDGARAMAKFWYVTLPLMTPTILYNVVVGIIGAFQVFAAAFIMTGGGPFNATLFYVLYMYRMAFERLEMGYSSAMAAVLFVLIMILTLVVFRSSRYWVHYEFGS